MSGNFSSCAPGCAGHHTRSWARAWALGQVPSPLSPPPAPRPSSPLSLPFGTYFLWLLLFEASPDWERTGDSIAGSCLRKGHSFRGYHQVEEGSLGCGVARKVSPKHCVRNDASTVFTCVRPKCKRPGSHFQRLLCSGHSSDSETVYVHSL